jgi:hypothetical protein
MASDCTEDSRYRAIAVQGWAWEYFGQSKGVGRESGCAQHEALGQDCGGGDDERHWFASDLRCRRMDPEVTTTTHQCHGHGHHHTHTTATMQKRKGKEMEMAGRSEQGAVAARPGYSPNSQEIKFRTLVVDNTAYISMSVKEGPSYIWNRWCPTDTEI